VEVTFSPGMEIDLRFAMRSTPQLIATHRNGLGSFQPFRRGSHLRSVATGCNHGAP